MCQCYRPNLGISNPYSTACTSRKKDLLWRTKICRQNLQQKRYLEMPEERVSWNTYFMNIAREVSTRSTCSRKHVGAVIVRNKTILSTGYNGSIKGLPHCDEVGCEMVDGHCIRTTHAEANAIVQAAKNGVKVEGSEIHVTASPCYNCFKLIANAGIKIIYYDELYRDERIIERAKEVGIKLISLEDHAEG